MSQAKKLKLPFEIDEKSCTECQACLQVCPKNCIEFNNSIKINYDACCDCNLCTHACPIINFNNKNFRYPSEAYAVWSLDDDDRKSSASGGAASVFYKQMLNNGGKIVGAVFDESLSVVIDIFDNEAAIDKLKGSKYSYSHTNGIYKKVKSELEANNKILFIALPCQVAALLQYLGKSYDNLITVDLICHGTPRPNVLEDYIKIRDKQSKSSKLTFRKDNEFFFELTNSDKVIYSKEGETDEYIAAFKEGLNYREACYNCHFAKSERISDITIGDFWGLGNEIPFDHPYTGSISVVLINTEKGCDFFDKCKPLLFYEKRTVSEAVNGNAQLQMPTRLHKKHDEYLRLLNGNVDFCTAVQACLGKEMQEEKKRLQKASIKRKLSKIKHNIIRS